MAIPGTDDTQIPPPAVPPIRPSWETAPRPAAPPRQAPAAPLPATAPRLPDLPPSAPPAASPYYAAPAPAAPALDPDTRYDLAGNAIPGSGSAAQSPTGRIAYSPGPAAGSWPPPPTSSAYSSPYGPTIGDGTDRVAKLRWNWGAFLIPFWWSIFNGQKSIAWTIFLINGANRAVPAPYDWILIIASLGFQFYLGFMGHRLAWSSDRFGGDYDNFIRTQRAWMVWGLCLTGVLSLVFVAAAILLPGFLAALSGPRPVHHHSYSNGAGQ